MVMVCGCGGGSDSNPDASVDPTCSEALTHSDLAWIQEEIFTPSCAQASACHRDAASQAGGLNLEAGQSRAALVNVPSGLFPAFNLVTPGDATNSYLMIILDQFDGPIDSSVGTMPYASPVLCKEKRDAIEAWIALGAPAT
jgi:hypothetical protein